MRSLYKVFHSTINKIKSIYFVYSFRKSLLDNGSSTVLLGKNTKINGFSLLHVCDNSIIKIGEGLRINSHTQYNFVGLYKPFSLFVGKGATLEIGENTGFSGTSIFCSKQIIIGSYCNFGGNVAIWDTDFHPIDPVARRKNEPAVSKPIKIGDDVFVGANSIILKGVTIGDRAVIGAGSVVSKDVPADEVWAGNPIVFIKKITGEQG